MAASDSFMSTCRTLILAPLPELTAFRTALTALESAGDAAAQAKAWHACYGDAQAGLSPAYRLRREIRNVVLGQATSASNPADLEDAYRRLAQQFAPDVERPATDAEEQAALTTLILNKLAE